MRDLKRDELDGVQHATQLTYARVRTVPVHYLVTCLLNRRGNRGGDVSRDPFMCSDEWHNAHRVPNNSQWYHALLCGITNRVWCETQWKCKVVVA